MYDMLPFPPIASGDTKEQVTQLYNYLVQFREGLEFILSNISTDNLSPELVNKLNKLGADISKGKEEREDQILQAANKAKKHAELLVENMQYIVSGEQTTISEEDDGVNVYTFMDSKGNASTFEIRNGSKGNTPVVTFSINFETGNLEYTTS